MKALIIVTIAVTGAVWDLSTRRIPNAITLGAGALALVFSVWTDGSSGLVHSLFGYLTGLVLFFPLFALGGMGAGDVKLVAAVGAWMGPRGALWVTLLTSVAGGALALLVSFARGYTREAIQKVGLLIAVWRHGSLRPVPGLTLADAEGPRIAYAVPIAVGVLATLWLGLM